MKKGVLISAVVSSLLMMSGCQVNKDDKESSTQTPLEKVQFVDSEVVNIDYYCDNGAKGVTDSNGYINIPSGCGLITLKIGGVVVGDFNTSKIHSTKVTPSDLLEIDLNNTLDSRLQNIVQFLQSVDNNQNPYDGIFIDDNVKKLLANANINLEDKNITESDLANLLKNAGIKLLDRNDTVARYEETLRKEFNLSVDNMPPAKPIVENIPSSFVETDTLNISVQGESKTKILLNGKDTGIVIPDTNKADVNVSLPPLNQRLDNDYNYTLNIQLEDLKGRVSSPKEVKIPIHGKDYYDEIDVKNVLTLLQNATDPRSISYTPKYDTGNPLQITYDPPYPYPPTAIDQNYTVTVNVKKGNIEDIFQFNEFVPSNNVKITLNDGTISLLNNQYEDEFEMTNGGVFVKKDDPDNFIGTSFTIDTNNSTANFTSSDDILSYISNSLSSQGYTISQVSKKVISPTQVIARYEVITSGSVNLYKILEDLLYNAFGYNINYDQDISKYADVNDTYLDVYVEYNSENNSYVILTLTNKDKDYTSEVEKIVNPDTLVQPNEKIVNETEHFVFTNDHYMGDYVFVIDDSGSMSDEQESVKKAIEKTFSAAVNRYGLDWKATVLGTERTWDYSKWLNNPVENNITKLVEELDWLTTDGWDEVGMKLVYDHLVNGDIQVRPNSPLTIIYASDEPEHTTLEDINVTDGDLSKSYFVTHHIKYDVILPESLQNDSNLAYRMALATHGDIVNMYNYETGYDEMANNAVREAAAKNSSIKLKYPAIASSINVLVNDKLVSGWEYVPTEQAIIFPQSVKPNYEDNVTVIYSHLDFEQILEDAINKFNSLPDDEKRTFTYPNVEVIFSPDHRLTTDETNDSVYDVNVTFKVQNLQRTVTYQETPISN
jgi:hypothetical protein